MVVYFTTAGWQHLNIEIYQITFTHGQATAASIGTVKGKLLEKDQIINQEKLKIKLDAEHIEHKTKN